MTGQLSGPLPCASAWSARKERGLLATRELQATRRVGGRAPTSETMAPCKRCCFGLKHCVVYHLAVSAICPLTPWGMKDDVLGDKCYNA